MSTRRPKVPRQPAAAASHRPEPGAPARPRPPAGADVRRAKAAAEGPAEGAGTGLDPQPERTAGTGRGGRPRGTDTPAAGRAARSEERSRRRAEARAELEGAIRTGVDGSGPKAPSGGAGVQDSDFRPVPAKAFSGRLLALGLVMLAITVLLAPSVHTWAQQRSEIAALEAEIAAARAEQEGLEHQLERWEDPAFVRQQARDRIFLVLPGDRTYLVKGEDGVQAVEQDAAAQEAEDLQWVDELWESVRQAATAP